MNREGLTIRQKQTGWEMKIVVSIQAEKTLIWQKIATTSGYVDWFPEIHVINGEKPVISFESEGFQENLPVHHFLLANRISYGWSGATVDFQLLDDKEGVQLIFTEQIPHTFPHPVKDMTGWCVQMERLTKLCEGKIVPTTFELKEKWEKRVISFIKSQ